MLVPCATAAAATAKGDAATACADAAERAERAFDLPAGLLRAIGEVESGLLNRWTGQIVAWPWAVDEAGIGQFFPSAQAAVAYVARELATGARNIDIGCFQISLLYHAEAFTTVEQAFDPDANAEAAARLLVALRARSATWDEAAGLYHSATPWRAAAYRDLVLRRWTGVGAGGAALIPPRLTPAEGIVVRVILPSWAARVAPDPVAAPAPHVMGPTSTRVFSPRRRGLPNVQTPSRDPVHG